MKMRTGRGREYKKVEVCMEGEQELEGNTHEDSFREKVPNLQ